MSELREIEERLTAIEQNLTEAIIRAEAAEAVSFLLLGRALEQYVGGTKSAVGFMRSVQAELFERIRPIQPQELSNAVAEYVGAFLQSYWSSAQMMDNERPQSEKK